MEFVQLGLETKSVKKGVSGLEAAYAAVIQGLLDLVSTSASEVEGLDAGDFRRAIGEIKQKLSAPTDAASLARDGERCMQLCRQHFERARHHVAERKAGFVEVIEVLTKGVDAIAGHSVAFNARVLGESEQIGKAVHLEDVSELKRQVAERVTTLRRAVIEKQQKDLTDRARLSNRVKALQTRLSEAEVAASLDPLTNVANRREFERTLHRFIDTSLDSGRSFALALIDVDDFKKVNDEHGHVVGDRVITALAQRLSRKLRKTDLVARYGGEEFALLLADTNLENATRRLASLAQEFAESAYTYDDSSPVKFTVSGGVAEYSLDETDEDLIRRADEGLYAAKRAGKNRVLACPKVASAVGLEARSA
jgi:diguanylate cyclase